MKTILALSLLLACAPAHAYAAIALTDEEVAGAVEVAQYGFEDISAYTKGDETNIVFVDAGELGPLIELSAKEDTAKIRAGIYGSIEIVDVGFDPILKVDEIGRVWLRGKYIGQDDGLAYQGAK